MHKDCSFKIVKVFSNPLKTLSHIQVYQNNSDFKTWFHKQMKYDCSEWIVFGYSCLRGLKLLKLYPFALFFVSFLLYALLLCSYPRGKIIFPALSAPPTLCNEFLNLRSAAGWGLSLTGEGLACGPWAPALPPFPIASAVALAGVSVFLIPPSLPPVSTSLPHSWKWDGAVGGAPGCLCCACGKERSQATCVVAVCVVCLMGVGSSTCSGMGSQAAHVLGGGTGLGHVTMNSLCGSCVCGMPGVQPLVAQKLDSSGLVIWSVPFWINWNTENVSFAVAERTTAVKNLV